MVLEDYFDFLAADDIRPRGTRIGIESVLYESVQNGRSPEQIAELLPVVTIEQIYASVLYYLRNRAVLDAYLANWLESGRASRDLQAHQPSPAVSRLRERIARHESRRRAS